MGSTEPITIEVLLRQDRWLRELAARLARDAAEAEELVQETWLAALRSPPREGAGEVRGWLWRVLDNARLQLRRAEARRTRRETLVAEQRSELRGPAAEEVSSAIELRQLLLDELQGLEEPQRTVLALRFLEGLSLEQVAEELGLPRETIKSRQARGLQLLRERLDRRSGSRQTWLVMCAPLLRAPARGVEGSLLSKLWMASLMTKIGLTAAALVIALGLGFLWQRGGGEGMQGSVEPTSSELHASELAELEGELSEKRSTREQLVDSTGDEVNAVNLEVLEVHLVDGLVIDVEGRPVNSVRVQQADGDGEAVQTDRAGRFEWHTGDEPELLTVADSEWTTVMRGNAGSKSAAPLVLVVARAASYAGVVVDEEGQPLSGVALRLDLNSTWSREIHHDLSACSLQRWHATSDEYGRFVMRDVPALEDALLWAHRGEHSALFSVPGTHREDLRLVLNTRQLTPDERWAGIEHLIGRILTPEGEPAAGAKLFASDYECEADAAGGFRLPFAALEPDTVLRAFAHGRLPLELRAPGAATDPHAGWPERLELRFDVGAAGKIRGVLLGASGEPLVDRQVWLADLTPVDDSPYPSYSERQFGDPLCMTDDEGAFELSVLHGRGYRLRALDRETWTQLLSEEHFAGDHFVRLQLPEPAGLRSVSGRCLAVDGSALGGVKVSPRWTVSVGGLSREYSNASTETDAEGRFHFEEVQLGFDSFTFEGAEIMPQACAVEPPGAGPHALTLSRRAQLHVSVSLDAPAGQHFMLRDEEGRAVELYRFQLIAGGAFEGADITAWGQLEEGASPTYTLAEGRYDLKLFAGESLLRSVPIELRGGETREVQVD